ILAGIAAIASGLSVPFLVPWIVTCRPDMLALAFSLWGLVAVQGRSRFGDLLATAAFVGGIFSKHSFVSAPIAAIVSLLLGRKHQRALRIGAGLAVAVVGLAAACEWWSEGWFLKNVIFANKGPSFVDQPGTFLMCFCVQASFPLGLAVAGMLCKPQQSLLPL